MTCTKRQVFIKALIGSQWVEQGGELLQASNGPDVWGRMVESAVGAGKGAGALPVVQWVQARPASGLSHLERRLDPYLLKGVEFGQ